jgi:hypothetical protein
MRFRDASWWWIFIPLLVGHLAVIAFCAYAGWVWGRALFATAGGSAPWLGAALGLLAWWTIGAAVDWLGYRISAPVTRGRYEFQALSGPLAGWTLPVALLLILAVFAALCAGAVAVFRNLTGF